jgi:molecular chaperone DnaK (HSP70)
MIVGIDLGTTNSAIGIWRDGRALLIPNSRGSVLTPSAVSDQVLDKMIEVFAANLAEPEALSSVSA